MNDTLAQVKMRVEVADPKQKLVEIASKEHPTMIVMGNHGKSGKNREIGSVSDFCVRKCTVPVVVIREPISE